MDSPPEPLRHLHRNLTKFLHTTTTSLLSLLSPPKTIPPLPSSKNCTPLLFSESPLQFPQSLFESPQSNSVSSQSGIRGISSAETSSAFPSTVRIAGLSSGGKGGGPAFVGQVFSMCDLSGTGLMTVSTHFDIPFLSERTPEWLKKVFATIARSKRNGPVFRFFMDIGDAVSYVKHLNIPSGVVGACRLDLAYEHYKEKTHMYQFVPNEKQVKAANKILKTYPQNDGRKKVDGVPVFGAENLDIAIATSDGIKWYTPYFFDKNMLDNILEESVEQHFHALIQTRHIQRRREGVNDIDNLAEDVMEELGDSTFDTLEDQDVQHVVDEIGESGIPWGVVSKAAEIQLLHTVDKVVLGNRWLRKATGIQPKFPYVIDSFERRTEVSFRRAAESARCLAESETNYRPAEEPLLEEDKGKARFRQKSLSEEYIHQNLFLPKITMVGISTSDGQMSKSTVKKTMDNLTKELEKSDQGNASDDENEMEVKDRDPLFVANVGDYLSSLSKTKSARWIREVKN